MFENMTPREKMLAMIVGSLAPILLLFFAFLWFMDRYESNADEIDDLTAMVEEQESIKRRGMLASQRQGYYRKASLPAKQSRAKSVYMTWLADLIQKDCGMSYSGVDPKESARIPYERETVATRNSFQVQPKGTLQQLIKFLHGFYSADHLHRINKLSIKPTTKSKRGKEVTLTGELRMEIEIETLSLIDGPANIDSFPVWKKELRTVDDYGNQILARNIFGPANNTPSLDKPRNLKITIAKSEEAAEGKYKTIQLSASDADKDDILNFELVEESGQDNNFGVVLGDQPITATQRKISLRVPMQAKPVRIPLTVRVCDNGLPAKSDELKFTIAFEKPPKAPKIEEPEAPIMAKEATLTNIVGLMRDKDGRWVARVHVQTRSSSQQLAVGESMKLDDQDWKVVEVTEDVVTFEIDGERKSFGSGGNLGEPLKVL